MDTLSTFRGRPRFRLTVVIITFFAAALLGVILTLTQQFGYGTPFWGTTIEKARQYLCISATSQAGKDSEKENLPA
jgi:hypothetical protein